MVEPSDAGVSQVDRDTTHRMKRCLQDKIARKRLSGSCANFQSVRLDETMQGAKVVHKWTYNSQCPLDQLPPIAEKDKTEETRSIRSHGRSASPAWRRRKQEAVEKRERMEIERDWQRQQQTKSETTSLSFCLDTQIGQRAYVEDLRERIEAALTTLRSNRSETDREGQGRTRSQKTSSREEKNREEWELFSPRASLETWQRSREGASRELHSPLASLDQWERPSREKGQKSRETASARASREDTNYNKLTKKQMDSIFKMLTDMNESGRLAEGVNRLYSETESSSTLPSSTTYTPSKYSTLFDCAADPAVTAQWKKTVAAVNEAFVNMQTYMRIAPASEAAACEPHLATLEQMRAALA